MSIVGRPAPAALRAAAARQRDGQFHQGRAARSGENRAGPAPALGALVRPGMSVEATSTRAPSPSGGPTPRDSPRPRITPDEPASAPLPRPARALHPFAVTIRDSAPTPCVPMSASLGVLLGSIMAVLGSRVTTFGLADLRGGLHLGFDEGAWMTTSFGVGQMMIGVACPYLCAIFGARRVLLWGIALFFIASLLGPLFAESARLSSPRNSSAASAPAPSFRSPSVSSSAACRLAWSIYGIAVYAMNSELSQNVAASLEGWYSDHWSWRWIDWQYCLAAAADVRVHLVRRAAREDQNRALLISIGPDSPYAGLGFCLL